MSQFGELAAEHGSNEVFGQPAVTLASIGEHVEFRTPGLTPVIVVAPTDPGVEFAEPIVAGRTQHNGVPPLAAPWPDDLDILRAVARCVSIVALLPFL